MVRVITYGTYDKLHYGHIRLLERAKALGDYLIVGITSSDFDKTRGKINVQQSLTERIHAIQETGLADEIIIEEYEGQKIDDIQRYHIDIFTVGSDWRGYFDYLNDYCQVVYLDRTKGISSSEIRSKESKISLGIAGDHVSVLSKIFRESKQVNGLSTDAIFITKDNVVLEETKIIECTSYQELLNKVDAVYVAVHPSEHDYYIRTALEQGKHVICETPIAISKRKCDEYFSLADQRGVVLMEGLKTAYSTAYERLLLLLKSGIIGNVISVDANCSSLLKHGNWGSMHAWGAFALLPILDILGMDYLKKQICTWKNNEGYNLFTKIDFVYPSAVASLKVGNGMKTEGELIISGTKGYVVVPSPWWKTDYFEIRFERAEDNKRYFYQLEGEGIRYMLVNFLRAVDGNPFYNNISRDVSVEISKIMEDVEEQENQLSITL